MFSFPYVDSDLGYWYIIWDEFEKHPLHYASCGADFMQSLSSFNISSDPYVDALIIGLY